MAYNYYPNNQFYMQDLQNMKDRIDSQMRQLQNQQPIQQPQIHQNFQLAPQSNFNELQSGYANNQDEEKRFTYEDICEYIALSNNSINNVVDLYLKSILLLGI